MNKLQRNYVSKRTEAIDNYLGSRKVKKTFKSLIRDPYLNVKVAKVTNQDYKFATSLMKNTRPENNRTTRQYRVSSADGKKAFTYF